MNSAAIQVEHLSKTFRLPQEKQTSIKGALINFHKRGYQKQQVLDDVSFEIKKGEFFGIVGRNGSGKSTLLKLLAGIYSPSSGKIRVNGKLTPFIELGVGFNPELTGRENVFLNGALLGFSRKEMSAMYSEIVEFAELERFMDQKLKNYSSGMQVRLAFSIAVQANSEILVLDEVLAVGDSQFQSKCFNYFNQLKRDKVTVVLVTHDMSAVQKYCDKALILDKGKLLHVSDPHEAAYAYQKLNFPVRSSKLGKDESAPGSLELETLEHSSHKAKQVFQYGDKIIVKITWPKSIKDVKNIGITIMSQSGQYIFGANTILDNKVLNFKENTAYYTFEAKLGNGNYILNGGLFGDSETEVIVPTATEVPFTMVSKRDWEGLTFLEHEWKD